MTAVANHIVGAILDAKAKPLRVAVIGTGKISEAHLQFLNNYAGTKVEAVCDLSPSLARYASRRFNAGRPYTDHALMLAEEKPQVVHVLTPPHTHTKLVTDCLDAGAHVIVEKPVAPSNAEFQDLWNHARKCGRRIIEDHNYRFNRPVLAIEELVGHGRLGEVRDVEVRMSLGIRAAGGRYSDTKLPHPSHKMPAGVLHEFITHLCYLMLRFVPSYERVSAAWSNHGGGELFKFDDLDATIIGGPVHGRIRFSASTNPECFMLTVRGTKGSAETDLFQPYLRVNVPRKGGAQLSPLVNQFVNGMLLVKSSISGFYYKVMQRTPLEGLDLFLTQTYDALRTDREPPVNYENMDSASRLIDALLSEANRV